MMWLNGTSRGGRPLGGGSDADESTDGARNRGQGMFNLVSLIVATVGSVAGVLALFVSK